MLLHAPRMICIHCSRRSPDVVHLRCTIRHCNNWPSWGLFQHQHGLSTWGINGLTHTHTFQIHWRGTDSSAARC